MKGIDFFNEADLIVQIQGRTEILTSNKVKVVGYEKKPYYCECICLLWCIFLFFACFNLGHDLKSVG